MKWKSYLLRYYFILLTLLTIHSLSYAHSSSNINELNQKLINYSDMIQSGKTLSDTQINEAKQIAMARQKILIETLSTGENVSTYLLSNKIINTMPSQVSPYLEKEVGPISGKLEVRMAEMNGQSDIIQYLLYQGNNIYYLHFLDTIPANFETDAQVHIRHAIKIHTLENVNELIVSAKDVSVIKPNYALPLSIGPQSTLTFLVNFVDKPADRPWTPAQITTLMYTTISRYFFEASYQQTSLTGQTVGWYVVNVNSNTACGQLPNQVASLADQAATNAGVDLSKYKRKVYIFPKTTACSWAGLGVVGGSNTRSWINGAASSMRTPAHELGHNFGIYHSRLLICPGSPNTGNCTRQEYGDGTDIMGAARTSHFNAHQKDRLGWLNYEVSPPITTVTSSGTYQIDAYETKNNNPKALRILKRAGSTDYYYLEFRQGIGYDAELASCGANCDYTKGVVFHQGNTVNGNSSDLLDMSPNVGGSGKVALLPGQSWTDPLAPNGGVTFTVVSVQTTGATVKVSFANAP